MLTVHDFILDILLTDVKWHVCHLCKSEHLEVKLRALSEHKHPSCREDLTGYEICPHTVTSSPAIFHP